MTKGTEIKLMEVAFLECLYDYCQLMEDPKIKVWTQTGISQFVGEKAGYRLMTIKPNDVVSEEHMKRIRKVEDTKWRESEEGKKEEAARLAAETDPLTTPAATKQESWTIDLMEEKNFVRDLFKVVHVRWSCAHLNPQAVPPAATGSETSKRELALSGSTSISEGGAPAPRGGEE